VTARDFWPSSGYRHLTVGADGRLTVTDAYLRAQLLRPELAPIAESCDAELALHDALVAAPRPAVEAAELAAIRDEDARENYQVVLRFRDRLLDGGLPERGASAFRFLFGGQLRVLSDPLRGGPRLLEQQGALALAMAHENRERLTGEPRHRSIARSAAIATKRSAR